MPNTCTYAKCTCYHRRFHIAFKTAVWQALDGTKKINCFFSYINVPKQPVSRNQFQKIRSIVVVEKSRPYHSKTSKQVHVHICLGIFLKKKRLRPWGRGILHERLHWQMYISKAKFKLNWFNCNSTLFSLIYLNVCLFSARF